MNTNTSTQISKVKEQIHSLETGVYTEEIPTSANTYKKDVISQFRMNLSQLEDLHGRVKFLMNEVSGVIKKRV